ncbi:MAG TPA: DUF3352 domain-containing protein [Planctomycetota bacterium]|nr:DUF3352 domain-containing protein [Planctomycetota bacterium]HRR78709.1 DUF3352 domain-containing protein [Planctomycetota bacterium]
MRRFTWIAHLLALAWAASGPAADLASVVPEDALIYAEVNDPKGLWADFERSGLRDILRAAPQAEMQFGVATALVRGAVQQRLGLAWDDFVGKLGSRFAVVLAEGGGEGRPPVFLLDAADTKAELTKLLKETVEPALTKAQGNPPAAAIADEVHGDVPLRILRGPGGGLAYGFLGDALLLGEPPAVKKLIDARARRPLAANQAFLRARKALDTPKGIVAYLNLAQVIADHRPVLDGNPELQRLFDAVGLTTVQWIALSSRFDGRGIRDRVHLHTGERQLGLIGLLGGLSAGTSTAAQVLPKDCPILLSLNFKDGPELWQGIVRFLQAGGHADGLARLDEGKQSVKLQFGINFDDDFVGALGGEVFLAANPDFVAEFAAKRRAPTADDFAFILGARVAKPEALKTTIHRLMAGQPGVGQGIERRVETHQGIEVNTLLLPDPERRPAYAFVGDFFLAAKSAAIIRQCIDARAAGQSLALAPRFRNVADAMPLKHHAVAYADIEALAVALLAADKEPAPGEPARPILATLGLLAGQLRGACAALTAGEDGVTFEAYSRPGLLPLAGAVLGFAERRAAAPTPGPQPKGPRPADF